MFFYTYSHNTTLKEKLTELDRFIKQYVIFLKKNS